jgi:hypothetical protein
MPGTLFRCLAELAPVDRRSVPMLLGQGPMASSGRLLSGAQQLMALLLLLEQLLGRADQRIGRGHDWTCRRFTLKCLQADGAEAQQGQNDGLPQQVKRTICFHDPGPQICSGILPQKAEDGVNQARASIPSFSGNAFTLRGLVIMPFASGCACHRAANI